MRATLSQPFDAQPHAPSELRARSMIATAGPFSPQPQPLAPPHPDRELSRASVPAHLAYDQGGSPLSKPPAPSFSLSGSPVQAPSTSGDGAEGGGGSAKKGSGIVLSFHSGAKHYEGNFTSVMKAMWSDAKHKVGGGASTAPEEGTAFGGGGTGGTDKGYLKQTTGDGKPTQGLVQRYMPQTTGGGGSSGSFSQGPPCLVDSTGGVGGSATRLRMPPPPNRPVQLALPSMPSMTSLSLAEPTSLVTVAAAAVTMAAEAKDTVPRNDWDPFGLR